MNGRSFLHRYVTWIAGAAAIIALSLALAYQVWASDQNDHTQARITRAASTCTQVDRTYSTLVRLMLNDSSFTPAEVAAMARQRRDRLHDQDCDS